MYLNDDTLDTIDKSSGRIHRVHVAKEDDLGSQENTENQVFFFLCFLFLFLFLVSLVFLVVQ